MSWICGSAIIAFFVTPEKGESKCKKKKTYKVTDKTKETNVNTLESMTSGGFPNVWTAPSISCGQR